MTHLKIYCAVMAVLIGLFVCAVIDSSLHSAEIFMRPLQHVAPVLPSMDAVLDNSARYIRHLSLATPASAFSDFPAQADYLPAGIAWAPPAFVGVAQPRVMAPVDPCPDKQP